MTQKEMEEKIGELEIARKGLQEDMMIIATLGGFASCGIAEPPAGYI